MFVEFQKFDFCRKRTASPEPSVDILLSFAFSAGKLGPFRWRSPRLDEIVSVTAEEIKQGEMKTLLMGRHQ